MAEEFVRKEHFEQFVHRMDDRFLGVEKRMEQGFAHAAKERENFLVHVNQRFDSVNQRFDDMIGSVNHRFDDMNWSMKQGFENLEKRFDDQRKIVVLMLSAILTAVIGAALAGVGAAAKYLFFSS